MLLSPKALVIVTLYLEQLLEVYFAVYLALQSSICASAARNAMTSHDTTIVTSHSCNSVAMIRVPLSTQDILCGRGGGGGWEIRAGDNSELSSRQVIAVCQFIKFLQVIARAERLASDKENCSL